VLKTVKPRSRYEVKSWLVRPAGHLGGGANGMKLQKCHRLYNKNILSKDIKAE
jgi:hypothetical protein